MKHLDQNTRDNAWEKASNKGAYYNLKSYKAPKWTNEFMT